MTIVILLTLTQDGNMRNPLYDGKIDRYLATQYDSIGRVVKTGWITTADPINFAKSSFIIANDTNKLTENIYYANKSWIKHQGSKVLKPVGMGTLNSEFLWSYIERREGIEYTGNPVWQGKQHLRYNSSNMSQNPILDSDTYGVDWVVSGYNGMQQPDLTIRYLFEGGAGEVRTWQDYTYDRGRRLTDVKYNYALGGSGIYAPSYTLSNMVYNYKDQLIEKNIGLTGASALQSVDYTYNIRGWLTNINNVALNTGPTMSIMTPNMTGSATIQNLAIAPFINLALQDAVKPYRAANAMEMPPINDNNMDLFSQNITYENPATQTGATPQYNGNISSTTWQVLGKAKQAYGFTYDGLDRLTEAKYFDITEQYTAPYTSLYNGTDKKYNESVSYDIRGNITSLQRYGLNDGSWTQTGDPLVAGTFGLIDNLSYIYVKNSDSQNPMIKSNKLLQMNDGSLPNKGFKSDTTSRTSPNEEDYKYDDNGNLRYDRHKYITEITYNYLNLPKLIRFDNPLSRFNGSGSIQFVYDATGVKLRKIITYHPDANRPVETYDYINGAEYKNTDLQRFAHTEGAIARNEFGAFEHEYVLRDHLGNARVTFRDGINKGDAYFDWNLWPNPYVNPNADNTTGLNDGLITAADIKQVNHYYPFGLNMEGNWQGGAQGDNKYQYNEKQLNTDFGLNWNDYGARMYDAAMARFTTKDRFSEMYGHMSPYQYAANNPIRYIDVNGDSIPSYFYDRQGNLMNTIPEEIRQQFLNEQGIILGYNAKTHMLYYAGDGHTDKPISERGRNAWLVSLGTGYSDVILETGHNLYYIQSSEEHSIQAGQVVEVTKDTKRAMIDLADFDKNGQIKGAKANALYNPRSFNLMRVIEHEFFGHGVLSIDNEASNIRILNFFFADIPEIPGRTVYGDGKKNPTTTFSNGGTLTFDRKANKKNENQIKITDTTKTMNKRP